LIFHNDDYKIVFGSAAPFDGGKIGCGVMYKKTLQPTAIRQVALPGHERSTNIGYEKTRNEVLVLKKKLGL